MASDITHKTLLLWLLLSVLQTCLACGSSSADRHVTSADMLTYTWTDLLQLRHTSLKISESPLLVLIPKSLQRKCIRRKRGSRGGIRKRLRRWGSKLPLPAITLSNVRSLRNKTDELSALIQYDSDYRNTSMFCFTETWLYEDMTISLPGFTHLHAMTGTPGKQGNQSALHGCEWQVGKQLHSPWDCLHKALRNYDSLVSPLLSTMWIHTAHCDPGLCPWSWLCADSRMHCWQL